MLNQKNIVKLNKLLRLPATGNEQDWEIELADKNRIREFLEILKSYHLSLEEKIAIMSLVLSSFDDYISDGDILANNQLWKEITNIIDENKTLYKDILSYWALGDDIDVFDITHFVRRYINDSY